MIWWHKILWLAGTGALGTLARYGLQGLAARLMGGAFPWGTLTVNLVGTFAFGVVWALWERGAVSVELRMLALVGFMGAFTTFSSFMFETGQLMQDGQYLLAGVNLAGQNVLGILFFFAGLAVGKML